MSLCLGLSPFGHDTAYAVGNDKGEILVHCELERDIRIKQASANPLYMLYAILS